MSLNALRAIDLKRIKITPLTATNQDVHARNVVSVADRAGTTKFLTIDYILIDRAKHDLLTLTGDPEKDIRVMEITVVTSSDDEGDEDSDTGRGGYSPTTPVVRVHGRITGEKGEGGSSSGRSSPVVKDEHKELSLSKTVIKQEETVGDTPGLSLMLDQLEALELQHANSVESLNSTYPQTPSSASKDVHGVPQAASNAGGTEVQEGAKQSSDSSETKSEVISTSTSPGSLEDIEQRAGAIASIQLSIQILMEDIAKKQLDSARAARRPRPTTTTQADTSTRSSRSEKRRMERKIKKLNEQHSRDIKVMQENMQMIQSHIVNKDRSSHDKKVTAGLREGWMADTLLASIITQSQRLFGLVKPGETLATPECNEDRQLRLWYWEVVKRSLPDHRYLWEDLVVGDLRALWIAISTFNRPNARSTYTDLMKALVAHVKKKEVGIVPFLKSLDDIYTNLAICRRTVTEIDKKTFLLDLISGDSRYRKVAYECADDEKLDYVESVRRVKHTATRCGNLLSTSSSKKEANNAQTSGTPEANVTESKTGDKGKNKKKRDKKSETKTDDKSDKPKRIPLCENYLFGKCARSAEECRFKHADLSKVGKGREKRGKSDAKKTKSGKDEPQVCFAFRDFGTCSNDPCRFAHPPKAISSAKTESNG